MDIKGKLDPKKFIGISIILDIRILDRQSKPPRIS
jgi:hypothetical protein